MVSVGERWWTVSGVLVGAWPAPSSLDVGAGFMLGMEEYGGGDSSEGALSWLRRLCSPDFPPILV